MPQLPDKVISDRGPLFVATTMKAMVSHLGTLWNHSTIFHPQMDGQMEQVNEGIETYLHIYCHQVPTE